MSTPDPGDFTRGQHNGHRADLDAGDLLIADVRAYETPLDLPSDFIAEQTRILDSELAAFVADEGATTARDAKSGLLPGFETLTWSDLRMCPAWCIQRDAKVHADAFDQDPDIAPHRSIERTVHATKGGAGIDHTGRAEVTVQLEQDRYLTDDPTIILSVVVDGIEQYTWLTTGEARGLHRALGHLLSQTEPNL